MKIRYVYIGVFLAVLSGCDYCYRPTNLTVIKEQVERYYESGCYEKDLKKLVDSAIEYYESVLVDNKSIIVFDVDDTVLSDYQDSKAISFGFIPKLSHNWILRADAPAISEVKRLYDYLVKRGFRIIFLTGRKHDEYDATIKNLKDQGFVTFDRLIVRQEHERKMTAKEYKLARRKEIESQGFNIIGCIGDQWSDLQGGSSGYQVKLPNYRYIIE